MAMYRAWDCTLRDLKEDVHISNRASPCCCNSPSQSTAKIKPQFALRLHLVILS